MSRRASLADFARAATAPKTAEPRAWRPDRSDARACAALLIAWIATIAWLGLDGEFPVSDDWAYAHTVRVLVEEGRFERLAWTWVPMRTNAAIGWVAGKLVDTSFETLRFTSACFGALGCLAAFALCRQLGTTTRWAALAAVLYGWNPLHLPLSLTFMTDAVFGAAVNLALFALARGLPTLAPGWLAAGAAFAAAAALSRQPGLGIFLCAGLVLLAARPSRIGWLILVAALGALLAIGIAPERVRGALELNWYLRSVLGEPRVAFWALVRNLPTIAFTIGAIALPFALALAARLPRAIAAGSAGIVCALLLLTLAKLELGVPPGIDWWFDIGIGPGSHLEPDAFPSLPPLAAWLLAAVAGASAGVLGAAALDALAGTARDADREAVWLLALFGAVYVGALVIRAPFFDRYLIAVLAPLLALVARGLPDRVGGARHAWAFVAALPLVAFSIGATHDWREREKARAALLGELLAEGVSARRIDGGTPFNGMHNYGPVRFPSRVGRPYMVDDEFRVVFSRELPGYTLLRERPYATWMPPRADAAARVHRRSAP